MNAEREVRKQCLMFLTVMPSPYQRQLFQALADKEDFEVSVRYYTPMSSDREWAAPDLSEFERILPGKAIGRLGPSAHFNPGVLSELSKHTGWVVISDYSAITAQVAMWYLTLKGRRWIYWGEMPGMRKGWFRHIVRRLLTLPISIGARAVCAIGSSAVAAYREWLPSKVPVFNIPYFCDLKPFTTRRRVEDGRVVALFSGQFIERKGLDLLLDAFAQVAKECPGLELLLLGGNENSSFLTDLPNALRRRIRVAGFLQVEELPRVYAEADLFILPSRHDGWGVVVNEAIAAGLPIIVSNRVGAAGDLVVDGENGYIFDSENVGQLSDCLLQLATSAEQREMFGRASAERAKRFGLDEGVRRWKSALQDLEESGPA